MQLSSFGAQDVYITGNPQVTYFKLVYRRHTLFSLESVEQQFAGPVDFNKAATVTISRNGDLVGQVWLQVQLPDLYTCAFTATDGTTKQLTAVTTANGFAFAGGAWSKGGTTVAYLRAADGMYYTDSGYTTAVKAQVDNDDGSRTPYLEATTVGGVTTYANPAWTARWCNSVGHALIKAVEVEIGGQRVDRHTSEFLDAMSELSEPEERRAGLWEMIGKYDAATYAAGPTRDQARARTYYVPLKFFFCKAPGLMIPIVALQYHDIKLNFEFRDVMGLVKTTGFGARSILGATGVPLALDCRLFADFAYLDVEERRRFSQIPHEYLIEQTQFLGDEIVNPAAGMNPKISLSFNHPVKELVWLYTRYSTYQTDTLNGNDWFDYDMPAAANARDFFSTLRIQLNGNDRFAGRPPGYFRLVQPYQHHTRCPAKRVYCYSFALHPEDAQPSGTCNFSRMDSSTLNLSYSHGIDNGKLTVFAVGYNILRVASGLAGVAFPS